MTPTRFHPPAPTLGEQIAAIDDAMALLEAAARPPLEGLAGAAGRLDALGHLTLLLRLHAARLNLERAAADLAMEAPTPIPPNDRATPEAVAIALRDEAGGDRSLLRALIDVFCHRVDHVARAAWHDRPARTGACP